MHPLMAPASSHKSVEHWETPAEHGLVQSKAGLSVPGTHVPALPRSAVQLMVSTLPEAHEVATPPLHVTERLGSHVVSPSATHATHSGMSTCGYPWHCCAPLLAQSIPRSMPLGVHEYSATDPCLGHWSPGHPVAPALPVQTNPSALIEQVCPNSAQTSAIAVIGAAASEISVLPESTESLGVHTSRTLPDAPPSGEPMHELPASAHGGLPPSEPGRMHASTAEQVLACPRHCQSRLASPLTRWLGLASQS